MNKLEVFSQQYCSVEAAVNFVRTIQKRFPGINLTLEPSDWIEDKSERTLPIATEIWIQEIRQELGLPAKREETTKKQEDEMFGVLTRGRVIPETFFDANPTPSPEECIALAEDYREERWLCLKIQHARIDAIALLKRLQTRIFIRTELLPQAEDFSEMCALKEIFNAFCEQAGIEFDEIPVTVIC